MMMKFVLATTALSLIVSLGAVIHTQSEQPAHRPPPGDGERWIFAAGRIEGVTPEIELRPEIDGRATEILVSDGELVTSGQVLLRIDDQQHVHEVALAQAELDLAEAQLERLKNGAREQECLEAASEYAARLAELERAELELGRRERLREKEAITQKELDDQRCLVNSLKSQAAAAEARADLVEAPAREDELQIARARVAAAQARLELARVQQDRTQLKSPISGQVLRVNTEPGELAGPTSREPAIELADTSRFRVRAFVEELDAPRVEVGMKATIRVDGQPDPDGKYSGEVTRLSPLMSRKRLYTDDPAERYDTKTREVWIDLGGGEGLVIGLRVDVIIEPQMASTLSGDAPESLEDAKPSEDSETPSTDQDTVPLEPRVLNDQ